ncbi:MAG: DUF493 family protein [Chitinivibrionales bacterium]|nr:DUF493 family protein [Chitinivibrionales bacterium]
MPAACWKGWSGPSSRCQSIAPLCSFPAIENACPPRCGLATCTREETMQKPHIDYPCNWSYRIIGQDEQLLRTAASVASGAKPHTVTKSNQSSGGKYCSLNVEVRVTSDADRQDIFRRLERDPAVKIVL